MEGGCFFLVVRRREEEEEEEGGAEEETLEETLEATLEETLAEEEEKEVLGRSRGPPPEVEAGIIRFRELAVLGRKAMLLCSGFKVFGDGGSTRRSL